MFHCTKRFILRKQSIIAGKEFYDTQYLDCYFRCFTKFVISLTQISLLGFHQQMLPLYNLSLKKKALGTSTVGLFLRTEA